MGIRSPRRRPAARGPLNQPPLEQIRLIDVLQRVLLLADDEFTPVQDQFTFLDMIECYGLKYRERRNGAWFRGIAVLPAYRVGR